MEVKTIEQNDKGRDGKVPAEEKTGTGTEPAGAGSLLLSAGKASKFVERATALRGLAISRPRTPKSTLRKRSLEEIRSVDPEVPYVKFEAAARDLVCSLMERQDRMNEEIFNKIVDLEYRLKDLELEMIDLNDKRGRS